MSANTRRQLTRRYAGLTSFGAAATLCFWCPITAQAQQCQNGQVKTQSCYLANAASAKQRCQCSSAGRWNCGLCLAKASSCKSGYSAKDPLYGLPTPGGGYIYKRCGRRVTVSPGSYQGGGYSSSYSYTSTYTPPVTGSNPPPANQGCTPGRKRYSGSCHVNYAQSARRVSVCKANRQWSAYYCRATCGAGYRLVTSASADDRCVKSGYTPFVGPGYNAYYTHSGNPPVVPGGSQPKCTPGKLERVEGSCTEPRAARTRRVRVCGRNGKWEARTRCDILQCQRNYRLRNRLPYGKDYCYRAYRWGS